MSLTCKNVLIYSKMTKKKKEMKKIIKKNFRGLQMRSNQTKFMCFDLLIEEEYFKHSHARFLYIIQN